ncbi:MULTISPECIES: hypothetical protein [Pseudomonas]|jgi:hypothetical protein|uniref:Uncharacterized protein n=1 Tax=Pseudomonas yamanorum TaxID=515393 RepID=A0A7Y8EDM1_9PSED|nr:MULTISPECIES: hypothetical protein [Pseudomonas]NWE12607.1 hypothetical protein [Pseudomonas yamanorum]
MLLNENNDALRTTNPLISYGVLFAMLVLGLIPFLLMSAAYGTANTELWSAYDASSILMIAAVMIVFGIIFYVLRENDVTAEAIARRIIDIDEFKNKKYIDYLLAHYGNAASVAAFFASLTFIIKSNLPTLGVTLSSLILSLALPALIIFYGLIFAKTVFGAINRHPLVWLSLMPMLLLDITLFTMAIKGIPRPEL